MGRLSLRHEPRSLARALVCVVFAVCACGCAASRGADPSRPRAESPYPVTLAASEERVKAARDAWTRLSSEAGDTTSTQPELRPVTATLGALPLTDGPPLLLPSVGGADGKEATDEETRESLRRFLAGAAPLLGVLPAELSLVGYDDAGGGLRRATYQQTPFLYPLRGGYGRVEVVFAPGRRVVRLSSTAIPDAERLRRAFAAAPQDRITAERAAQSLVGRALAFTDAQGNARTRTVAEQGETSVRELVVYPLQAENDPATLELHLAWEIAVAGSLVVYIDAINGVQLAVSTAPES